MPQAIVPLSSRRARRSAHASGALRLDTWLHRRRLDDLIAHGAVREGAGFARTGAMPSAGSDPRLALRSRQLRGRPERERLARDVEHVLAMAGRPTLSSRVPLRAREIRECADDLVALAERLRSDSRFDVQGVAMAKRLLSDGAGPLYHSRAPVSLRYAVRSARLALEPVSAPQVEQALPMAA